ncbi:thiamine pyrophosphate-binding protein [Pseudonocardia nematodicida]|uniref:Thiamine pyrophosphate-binding protein n=1 Tax=Pseudonocardia nematodicida TaxID=1206997 RepID=A0ABV1K5V5_9PSEU
MSAAAPGPGRTGADLVVACLVAEGIEIVTGVPGTTVMDVIDGIAREPRIRFVATRHEQVAGFMADGASRAGAAPGTALVSRGPGAANLAIAVQNAYDESVPMLVLVGQVSGAIVERRAFEEMDVVATFRPMSKWAVEIHDVARIPELLQRAIRASVSGRPGPVVVSLPLDVLQHPVPDGVVAAPRWRPYPPAPAPDAVTEAARLLAGAERPVLLLGGGAVGDPGPYLALAERTGAAVVTTWMRQSLVPYKTPGYVGCLGYGAHEVTEQVVREADVLVAFGCRFSEFTTKRWTLVSDETALIHVDVDPEELGRVHPPRLALVADARLAAQALLDRAERTVGDAGRERLAGFRGCFEEATDLTADALAGDDPRGGVSGASGVRALQHVLDRPDTVLVQDAPSFVPWMQRHLRVPRARSVFGSAGGAMAWGLPAAMGIALARPRQRVVTVSGDGSFWMVAQDFETCVREGIPLVNLVMNNFAYGNTRDRQRAAHGERYLGVFYDNLDFAGFARSLGGYGARVETDDGLLPAVESALDQDRPAIIDVLQHPMYGLPPGLTPLPAR